MPAECENWLRKISGCITEYRALLVEPVFYLERRPNCLLQEYVREGSNEKLNPPQLQPDQLRDQPEQLQIEGIKNVTATI